MAPEQALQSPAQKVDPICLGCNYPLSQLDPSTRACPECGRTFDPDDPRSMNTSRAVTDFLRRWLEPVRWLLPALRAAVIVTLVANILLAGAILASWLVLCLLSAAIGTLYYLRKVARRAIVTRYVLPPSLLDIDRAAIARSRRWFVLAAVLLFFRLPFYVVFLISLHWLNASGHNEYAVRPYFEERPAHTLIGLLPVRQVRVTYQGAFYDTWLGGLQYVETDDGKHSWSFHHGNDVLLDLPW